MSVSKIFVPLFMFFVSCVVAQDPHFSQFYQAPIYLNPGFTGITEQQRVTLNYRAQWPNLPQTFATYAASYDIWVDELRSGFGILATTDRIGSAAWNTTTVGLLYSYKIRLGDKVVIAPGVYFGYGINGIDRTKITLGDELLFEGRTIDPTVASIGNKQYFDFTSGILIYTKKIWLGGSFHHINNPNISILNITTRVPMKVSIHGGIRIPISNSHVSRGKLSYLTPSFVFRLQGPITQLDIGINYHIDPIYIGLWYRGKPYEKNMSGSINQDAIIFQLGAYLRNFSIGYSYDFSISELLTSSGGAHEVSIIYEFAAGSLLRREKKNTSPIPCPTFRSKSNLWSKK